MLVVTKVSIVISGALVFVVYALKNAVYTLYEASDLILGDHLYEKSDTVKWIDAFIPHKRKRRLKDHDNLLHIQMVDPNSNDIFEGNLIDNYYPLGVRKCLSL